MSLLLAVEPDRRQAAQLTSLAREPLNVELVLGDTTESAFAALGARVPDLVLTSQLLSPKDEAALAERLRELDAAGAHVQTLVIPVLGNPEGGKKRSGGLFGRLRRSTPGQSNEGCDPGVFAAQITEYLERAAAERAALAAAQADLDAAWAEAPPAPAVPADAIAPEARADEWSSAGSVEPMGSAASAESIESMDATLAPADPALDPNSPEALFGEFAAIPIPKVEAPLADPPAPALPARTVEDDLFNPVVHVEPTSLVSQMRLESVDDEWQEIAIDAAQEAAAAGADPAHADLHAEAVDLDAFVRELETVPTSANAEPMIPVVDLTGHAPEEPGEAGVPDDAAPMAAASVLDDLAGVHQNDETTFAILQAPEPALDLGDELDLAVALPEPALETAPPDVAVSLPSVLDGLDPQRLAEQAEAEARRREAEEAARAAAFAEEADRLEAALAEAAAKAAAARASTEPLPSTSSGSAAGLGDLLSAIQRDIKVRKTDDQAAAPAPARPDIDLTKEPLVFRPRAAVTASDIAEAQSLKPKRVAPDPLPESPLASQVAQTLEASLQASLSARLALSPEPVKADGHSEVTERQAALEQQLVKAMAKADSFEPAPEPLPTAPALPVLDLSALANAAAPVDEPPAVAAVDVAAEAAAPTAIPDVSAQTDPTLDAGSQPEPALDVATQAIAEAFADAPMAAAADSAPDPSPDPLAVFAASTTPAEPDPPLTAGDDAAFESRAFGDAGPVDARFADAPSVDAPLVDALAVATVDVAHEEVLFPAAEEPRPAAAETLPAADKPRDDRKGSKHRKKRRGERNHDAAAAGRQSPPAIRISEWGLFDPHQVGFAVFAGKLNDVSARAASRALPSR